MYLWTLTERRVLLGSYWRVGLRLISYQMLYLGRHHRAALWSIADQIASRDMGLADFGWGTIFEDNSVVTCSYSVWTHVDSAPNVVLVVASWDCLHIEFLRLGRFSRLVRRCVHQLLGIIIVLARGVKASFVRGAFDVRCAILIFGGRTSRLWVKIWPLV